MCCASASDTLALCAHLCPESAVMMLQRSCCTTPCTSRVSSLQMRKCNVVCRPDRGARKLHLTAATGGRYDDQTPTGAEANTILDAFFLGRACAETLNERLGAALGDILSEVTKLNAEREYAVRSFQQEVQQRADREKEQRTGLSLGATSTSSSSSWQQSQPDRLAVSENGSAQNGSAAGDGGAATDVQAEVDELRAEVAYARSAVQKLRASRRLEQWTALREEKDPVVFRG